MNRHRLAALSLVAAAALVLVPVLAAETANAATRTESVLATQGPLSFSRPVDTYVEETNEDPSTDRRRAQQVDLRGNSTASAPTGTDAGRRAYLLALSTSGGAGVDPSVRDRYAHANVRGGVLDITYQGGCSSPGGHLTVRAIQTRAWDPATVQWNQTTLSENGTRVDLRGPVLYETPLNTQATTSNDNVTCGDAQVPLSADEVRALATGETGGLAILWEGEQPLTLNTLDADDLSPQLLVRLDPNEPEIHEVHLDKPAPAAVAPEGTVQVFANVTDERPLPQGGVALGLFDPNTGDALVNATARLVDGAWTTQLVIPTDASEGGYTVTAFARDGDGWTARATMQDASSVVVDASEPVVHGARLAGTESGNATTLHEDRAADLAFNVTDLTCAAGLDPCGTWRAFADGIEVRSGTVPVSGVVSSNLTLSTPGDPTIAVTVTDAVGHANETLAWPGTVEDTHPPDPRALAGSLVAPNLSTIVERDTPLPVGLQVGDDLPVDASLRFLGLEEDVTRVLPTPDREGRLRAQVSDLPVDDYSVHLILDDGTHRVQHRWGSLRVVGQGPPIVQIPLPGARIQPDATINATLVDESLDIDATRVNASVNGFNATPLVSTTPTATGAEVTVAFDGLVHGDVIELAVTAQDDLGLASTANLTIDVDGQAPRLTRPANGTWFAPDARVTVKASDPGGGAALVGLPGESGQSPLVVPASALLDDEPRLQQLAVRLEDDIGNQRTETLSLGLDTQPPEIEATIVDGHLVLEATDAESGVRAVHANVSIDGAPTASHPVVPEGPDRYRVQTPRLTRGQDVAVHATVRDQIGNEASLGSQASPATLTVPDQPPKLTLERTTPVLGDAGGIQWTVVDPDGDEIDARLTIEGPNGTRAAREPVQTEGDRTIAPDAPGRYQVTLTADAFNATARAETYFYLSPDGHVTRWQPAPERVDPGKAFTLELRFPDEPRTVHVVAVDEQGVLHPGTVDVEGSSASARFNQLDEGTYAIEATVAYDQGAVEQVQIASIDVAPSLQDQLSSLALPLLVLLAAAGLAVVGWLLLKDRGDEDEAT